MPFNGSGTFTRLYSWVVDAANNVNISSSRTDAEMNGFAAGLTNCITRDGQSPPSADIPWGAKKITNLAAATVGTDALNMATGDTRYLLASLSSVANWTISSATQASLNLTKTGTGAGTALVYNDGNLNLKAGVAGQKAIVQSDGVDVYTQSAATLIAQITAAGDVVLPITTAKFKLTDANGGTPYLTIDGSNNLILAGTDASGNARNIFAVAMHSGTSTLNILIGMAGQTPAAGNNSTLIATTAFVATSFAPLASPPLTGTPTAPTAASGTSTTQLATTAFADRLRDVPQNAQTASYALALTDRGGSVDFNGTTLTCTIPANGSVAFPIGTVILITNLNASNLSIAITTDTLTLSGTTTVGTRTLGQNGEARIRKVGATSWIIAGTALS